MSRVIVATNRTKAASRATRTDAGQKWGGTYKWRVLVESLGDAETQMARDVALAQEMIPTVRFFTWKPPAISLGFKQPSPAWLEPSVWHAAGLEWVERPTGGGVAFHGSDVSVAIIIPRALSLPLQSLMSAVCRSAVRLCEELGARAEPMLETKSGHRITYCLMETSPYAVFVKGRKVAGFALRRYSHTWLIQGSFLVRPLPAMLARRLPESVNAQLASRAVPLAEVARETVSEADVAMRWSRHWPTWWEELLCRELAVQV